MTDPQYPSQQLEPQATRRLVRSREDRMIAGVCGGIGRYLGIDPALVRIVAIALVLSGGAGILAYIVAWIAIPEAAGPEPPPPVDRPAHRHTATLVVGAALVGVGALLLMRETMPWFHGGMFWPLVVVAAGVLIVATARR